MFFMDLCVAAKSELTVLAVVNSKAVDDTSGANHL